MTFLPSAFIRSTFALVLAAAWAIFSISAIVAPAPAQASNAAYYTAELANPAKDRVTIAKGVVWSCSGTSCVAKKATSRTLHICKRAARKLGEIAAFTADGKALEPSDLSACNGN